MSEKIRYVAFLRGINVGGHHKVPMAILREQMEKISCEEVTTLLNTGNIIFSSFPETTKLLQKRIREHLESVFGFTIPVLIRTEESMHDLFEKSPFEGLEVTKEMRCYISFLMDVPEVDIALPWISEDKGYRILEVRANAVYSVLDLTVTKTPKGMEALERLYGKNVTTRNWNTFKRITDKLKL